MRLRGGPVTAERPRPLTHRSCSDGGAGPVPGARRAGRRDPRRVRIGRSTRAVVLAALLCHAGAPFPSSELVELVWGAGAPPTAATMVHGAVARLRTLLEADAVPGRVAHRLRRGRLRGRIRGRAGRHDVRTAARRWSGVGGHGAGPGRGASAAALALWRGPAYAGIGRPFARDEADRLEELRRRASSGSPTPSSPSAAPSGCSRSSRRWWRPTRRGSARPRSSCGRCTAWSRQADALSVYRRVRATLVEELGVEPGPALRAAEAEVLGGGAGGRQRQRVTLDTDVWRARCAARPALPRRSARSSAARTTSPA